MTAPRSLRPLRARQEGYSLDERTAPAEAVVPAAEFAVLHRVSLGLQYVAETAVFRQHVVGKVPVLEATRSKVGADREPRARHEPSRERAGLLVHALLHSAGPPADAARQ